MAFETNASIASFDANARGVLFWRSCRWPTCPCRCLCPCLSSKRQTCPCSDSNKPLTVSIKPSAFGLYLIQLRFRIGRGQRVCGICRPVRGAFSRSFSRSPCGAAGSAPPCALQRSAPPLLLPRGLRSSVCRLGRCVFLRLRSLRLLRVGELRLLVGGDGRLVLRIGTPASPDPFSSPRRRRSPCWSRRARPSVLDRSSTTHSHWCSGRYRSSRPLSTRFAATRRPSCRPVSDRGCRAVLPQRTDCMPSNDRRLAQPASVDLLHHRVALHREVQGGPADTSWRRARADLQ